MVSAKSCSNIVRLVLNNMHELVAEPIIAIILFRRFVYKRSSTGMERASTGQTTRTRKK